MLNDGDNSLQFWSAAMRQIQLPIGFGPAIYECLWNVRRTMSTAALVMRIQAANRPIMAYTLYQFTLVHIVLPRIGHLE